MAWPPKLPTVGSDKGSRSGAGTTNGLFALLTRRGPLCMSKSDKYQRFAEECLEIAQTAKDNQAKAVLLHMAQVWFRLAAEHAEHAKGG